MRTRTETMEKLLGRRAVSCFGFLLVLLVILMIASLIWQHTQPPSKDSPQPERAKKNHLTP